jgi:hypothetical protein
MGAVGPVRPGALAEDIMKNHPLVKGLMRMSPEERENLPGMREFYDAPYWKTPIGRDIRRATDLLLEGKIEESDALVSDIRRKYNLPKPSPYPVSAGKLGPFPARPNVMPPGWSR